jgi:hypothetical protein
MLRTIGPQGPSSAATFGVRRAQSVDNYVDIAGPGVIRVHSGFRPMSLS